MFVEITNEPRDYAWGSTTLIPDFLGVAPDGRPQAEIWYGTHPGSPARVAGREGDLRDVVGELPFLLKILAAGSPLSLQVHPTTAQAQAGFARENAAGIPIDAPHRTYKDPFAKPEMIYALSDEFRALSAFRPVAATRRMLDAVDPGLLADLRDDGDLRTVVARLLTTDVGAEVDAIVELAATAPGEEWATVRLLAAHYPGDPGIAVSLLLHTVVLARGEALYLPAGNMHAYLSGLGVEVMGPSDNVLRCGLTPKHIDTAELLEVVDFTPVVDPRLRPTVDDGRTTRFEPGAGWQLEVLGGGPLVDDGPSVVLVLDGELRGLTRGRAALLRDDRIELPAGTRVAVAGAAG
jgi:mannose-6-phosphate isomerase